MILVAIVCAVLGAVCSALGAHWQHRGVRAEAGPGGLSLRMLGRLARNPSWIRGFAVLVACAVLQILALALAPVAVVAPLVVLALPAVALVHARRLDAGGWLAVAVTTVAVAVFVARTAGEVRERAVPPEAVLWAGTFVGAVVLVLCLAALVTREVARCAALAMAAGAAYGLVVVLVRDVAYTVRVDGLTALPLLSSAGLAVAFLAGSWLIQLAYASGPPDVVVGAHTTVNPAVATTLGLTLLGEADGITAGYLTTLLICGGAAVAGIVVLARHHPDARRERTDAGEAAPR